MGVACLEFRGENFRGWLKNYKIRESFLHRKFPAIRYHFCTIAYKITTIRSKKIYYHIIFWKIISRDWLSALLLIHII